MANKKQPSVLFSYVGPVKGLLAALAKAIAAQQQQKKDQK